MTLFSDVVKGKNVMTPDVIRYVHTPHLVIELSTGRGLDGDDLYGVTVVNKDTKQRELELDDVFHSREFAEAYIAGLK